MGRPQEQTLGAPPFQNCPSDWTIEPLKLAVVLRVLDACQIDGRRAPTFVRSLRKPQGLAAQHWGAQESLSKPYCKDGKLVFTSLIPFREESREAWWTAYDLVKNADRELRAAEEFSQDQDFRLKANRAAGITSPGDFSKYVRIEGWVPVDAQPRISAVTSVIERLGGAMLYGVDYTVPLRELIQNARDAVVCRRLLERHSPQWGQVHVELRNEDSEKCLAVSDNGVGISEQNLVQHVLDFGSSYWKSPLSLKEHPDLPTVGFEPQGMFGIGFFSVFMLGDHVKLVTRQQEDSKKETRVLEFPGGLGTRPLIRRALPQERRNEPGTTVSVRLNKYAASHEGLLRPPASSSQLLGCEVRLRSSWSLHDLTEWLCPAMDVDLFVCADHTERRVVACDDWTQISAERLFRRLLLNREGVEDLLSSNIAKYLISGLGPVVDGEGRTIARATLIDNITSIREGAEIHGTITCGAFRATIHPMLRGLLLGEPTTASRFDAHAAAIAEPSTLQPWATQQAAFAAQCGMLSLEAKVGIAAHVRSLNGELGSLPIAMHCGEFVSQSELQERVRGLESVRLVETNVSLMEAGVVSPIYDIYDQTMIGGLMGRMYAGNIVARRRDPEGRAEHPQWNRYWYSLWGAAIEAVAESWQCSVQSLLENSTIVGARGADTMREPDELRRPV